MYWYILVCTGMYWYVPMCTNMLLTCTHFQTSPGLSSNCARARSGFDLDGPGPGSGHRDDHDGSGHAGSGVAESQAPGSRLTAVSPGRIVQQGTLRLQQESQRGPARCSGLSAGVFLVQVQVDSGRPTRNPPGRVEIRVRAVHTVTVARALGPRLTGTRADPAGIQQRTKPSGPAHAHRRGRGRA